MMQRLLLTPVNVDGKQITLAEYYIIIKGLREKWAKDNPDLVDLQFPLNSNPESFSEIQNNLINSFHSSILKDELFIGTKDKKSPFLVIRVSSDNELFSKTFAELVAREVSEFYIDTKTNKTKRELAILRHQADSVRREFNMAVQGTSTSLDANPNPNRSKARLAVPSLR
jgi:hypothetical protein